jgi:hypothetical protein
VTYRMIVIFLFAALLAVVCASSAPDNITGYSSGSDAWTLGAGIKTVNLDGFEKVSESDTQDCYFDPDRTLKFEGKDTEASVALYFGGGKLETFTINVAAKQKSFTSLKKYYSSRLTKCKFYKHGESSCEWVDKDKDYVSLGAVTDEESGADITAITYGWQSWVAVAE